MVGKAKGNSRKHNEIDLRYDEVSLTVDSAPKPDSGPEWRIGGN